MWGIYIYVRSKKGMHLFMELFLFIFNIFQPSVVFIFLHIFALKQGLLPAIQELLPSAEQRFCMRHLYSNFRKRFVGQKLKNLMWKAATVTHPVAQERVMKDIKKENDDAFKYLIAIPLRFVLKSHLFYTILYKN